MGWAPSPSPASGLKDVRNLIRSSYVILLSGTPTPESYSQMYHQVYGISGQPLREDTKTSIASATTTSMCGSAVINSLKMKFYDKGLPSILDSHAAIHD